LKKTLMLLQEQKEEEKQTQTQTPRKKNNNNNNNNKNISSNENEEQEETEMPTKSSLKSTNLEIDNKRTSEIQFRRRNYIWLSLQWANVVLAGKYVSNDTIKHKRAWIIGFFTVCLVVLFVRYVEIKL